MSNVPMTRPDEMLAFHDGPFGGHAFVGLEGGRILFSNAPISLSAPATASPGARRYTCPYSALIALDELTALLANSDFNYPDAQGRQCKSFLVRTVTAS